MEKRYAKETRDGFIRRCYAEIQRLQKLLDEAKRALLAERPLEP